MALSHSVKLFWAMADCLKASSQQCIIEIYGSLENAMENICVSDLLKAGMNKRSAESIMKKVDKVDIHKANDDMKKYGVTLLCHDDELFPESLKMIDDAPLFLFAKGNFDALTRKSLAVVGSRKVSSEGKWACEHVLPEIVHSGFTLVSGMAAGIDTLVHSAALNNGGATVAFWGTGIDLIYPATNRLLAEKIMKNGVVFSEFPFGTPPSPYNFPRRNRLVSGYSDGVLVVEGKEKSGSLITAEFAMEQGKDVFAIPGPIRSPLSGGPHRLIQEGAKLIRNAGDVLEEFGIEQESLFTEKKDYVPSSPEEKNIYAALSYSPLAFDILAEKTAMNTSLLSSQLMMMSLSGVVEDVGNGMWVRR